MAGADARAADADVARKLEQLRKALEDQQQQINSQNSPEGFINYYSMYANNPYNLGAPRQIRLGIRFDF